MIAAAVAGSQHDLGIQAVADFFEADGWRVIHLGCNVPAEDLAQAVDFYRANLLALSVSLATQLAAAEEAITLVRAANRGPVVKILVGGRGILLAEEPATCRGADGYAASALEAVARGNQLVGLGAK